MSYGNYVEQIGDLPLLNMPDRGSASPYRPTRSFQCAMNALVLDGAANLTVLTKGARMPSTANEVRAETSSPSLRATADFR